MLLFLGSKFANKNLPAVDVYFSYFLFPFSSIVLNLEIMVLCTFISPEDKANSIDPNLRNNLLAYRLKVLEINNKYLKSYPDLVQ